MNVLSLDQLILDPRITLKAYRRKTQSTALGTIETPAANTKGIVIFTALLHVGTAGATERLMFAAAAPTAWDDAASDSLLESLGGGGPLLYHLASRIIPAGNGLYEQCTTTGSYSLAAIIYGLIT